MKRFENVEVVWVPKEDSGQSMKQFRADICRKYNVQLDDYWSLHKWSVDNFRLLWAEIWDRKKLIYSKTYDEVFPLDAGITDTKNWFPGARLNIAENLLRYRDDHVAFICTGEERVTREITYAEVYKEACRYGAALKQLGLKTGDNVVCYMSNREEAVFAMLGTTSIGAIWSAVLPIFGAKGAILRFSETRPKFLFTIDRFMHNGVENNMLQKIKEIADELQCLEKIVIVPSRPESFNYESISNIQKSCFLPDFLSLGYQPDGSVPDLDFNQLAFDHPIYINYTSGTTGPPKCVVHGFGGLMSLSRHQIHRSVNRNAVCLSSLPAGGVMWFTYAHLLSLGLKILLFEGVPFFLSPTFFWDLIDKYGVSNLTLTSTILDNLEKKGYLPNENHHLSSLKGLSCTATIAKHQNYDFVYKKIKRDILFGSSFGSTELFGSAMSVEQTLPVHRGEITAPALAMGFECFNDQGKPVFGEVGELVVTTPTPSLPLCLWNDQDGLLFKKTYFKKFKRGFAVGDMCVINPFTRGTVIIGRSDDLLNTEHVLFGSVEIYNVVDNFSEIRDSICVSQYNGKGDERAVLFLKMRDGVLLTEDIVQAIRRSIERELTYTHVPEIILETADIPHNFNGKKMENLVKRIINNMPYSSENITKPESLQNFVNVPELYGYCENIAE